ncbi:hypothetical protein J5N97_000941 [Dioscorea zingiberensis]|uniref:Uncharacterized protein n=1 Tax=Dioscorea zingiberensis TaxID=325984 RepID=A0A9D5H2U8_9LILI|nr:hypothetical protein J5N97_000941 [Dioscorea zingiberensis]
MSAPSDDISFDKATKLGFHRLFQYIQGANLNSSRIRMTTPVLTSVVPDAGPLHSSAYVVRLYLPVKFQSSPPVPLPELEAPFGRMGTLVHCSEEIFLALLETTTSSKKHRNLLLV